MKPAAPTPSQTDADLEQALRESRSLQDAPEHLIQRAIDLWQHQPLAQPARRAEAGGAIQRVLAALRFDSRSTSALAMGLRATAAAETQQLLFSAEGHDIDLRITPVTHADGQRGWEVRGQVFGPSAQGSVELLCGDVSVLRAWDDLGEFCFDAVGAGQWRAVLRGAAVEIETPPFELGSAAAPTGRAGG
jgi:hypothetical protein